MSVTKTKKPSAPYEIIDRESIQSIRNPTALAVWVYLRSKPENWVVSADQILEHFGMGRDRYRKAMKLLVELGAVEDKRTQDALGRFVGREYIVHCAIGKNRRGTENPIDGKELPRVPEKPFHGKPPVWGNPPPLKNTEEEKIKNTERGASPQRSKFVPPTVPEVKDYCREKGYVVDADQFVAFYASKGWMVGRNKMKCWKSACTSWSRRNRQAGPNATSMFARGI